MEINLFSQLTKAKNTLYVFDIDETVLYYNFKVDEDVVKTIEMYEASVSDKGFTNKSYLCISGGNTKIVRKPKPDVTNANALWEETLKRHLPIAHDRDGMELLKSFCDENNSKIIFLTARFKTIEKSTNIHLQSLYKWVNTDDVHLCDGEEKGLVLSKLINPSDYDRIIFVDDKDYNIQSVKNYIPSVITYRMNINSDIPREA